MLPPRLSRRSRRKAGLKAVIARQERARVKEQVALGEIYFFDLFKDERKAIARMKLIDLLLTAKNHKSRKKCNSSLNC